MTHLSTLGTHRPDKVKKYYNSQHVGGGEGLILILISWLLQFACLPFRSQACGLWVVGRIVTQILLQTRQQLK